MTLVKHGLVVGSLMALVAACGGGAAPADEGAVIEEITDDGDLEQLVEQAEAEGQVVWYTSVPSERAEQIGSMFQEEYGIEVLVQRSGGADILQRYLLEAEAGQVQNDVLTISDPSAFLSLQEEGRVLRFVPSRFDEVPESARSEDGYWVATRVNAMVMAYRTDRVDDPPTGWEDLVDERFAGVTGHVNPNFSAGVMTVAAGISQDFGWEWYERFAQLDPLILRGNNQLGESLISGEVDVAAFLNSTYVAEAKDQGQPVEWVFPEDGVYMVAAPSAVMADAPNPNAGKLLAEYLLTDAVQELMIEEGNYAALETLPAPEGQPERDELTELVIDYDWLAENLESVRGEWNQIIDAPEEEEEEEGQG
ncbi:MAG: extracellular solute-binding protein [Nitriliruptorales bacterium]|nr:extracellular solute-binding protein [Nitriliruptorales bacterium]